jgi:integrase
MARRGQAPAPRQDQWKLWLEWLKARCGPRIYLVIYLTGALGLRCSEALTLKREDVNIDGAVPKVTIAGQVPGSKKSPGDVYVRKQHMHNLRHILKEGVTAKRTRGHKYGKGTRKTVTFNEHWVPPTRGFIFQGREDAPKGHLTYHAVYAHVKRQARAFAKDLAAQGKPVGAEVAKLRPHSGRATLITELMGEGMCTAMSMKYARHSPDSYKVHLKYGRLTLDDVKEACDRLPSSRPRTKWSTWSTKALLSAQKNISKELAIRAKTTGRA